MLRNRICSHLSYEDFPQDKSPEICRALADSRS